MYIHTYILLLLFNSAISSSAFLHENKLIATGSQDGFLKLYDISTKSVKRMISLCNLKISSMDEINNTSVIAIGSANNKLYIFNTNFGRATSNIEAHEDSIISVFYSKTLNKLITDSSDSTYKLWDVSSLKIPVQTYYDTDNPIITADFRKDDNYHICIDQDGTCVLRKINDDQSLTRFNVVPNDTNYVKFDMSNPNQFFIANNEQFDVYDIRMNQSLESFYNWVYHPLGIENDNESILLMTSEMLMTSKFKESGSIVNKWEDMGQLTHLRMKVNDNLQDKAIVIVGNENGDVHYAEI